jgi:hypothetical protein
MLTVLIWVAVIGSSLWVYWDAKRIGIQKGQINGILNMSPVSWFIACLFLWIIGFPLYLYKRPEYKRINGKDGSNTVPSLVGLSLIALLIFSMSVVFMDSTRLSTSDLASQVKASIVHTFAKNPELKNVTVETLTLVHKSGTQYKGILKVTDNGQEDTYVLNVTYDGKQFMWQIAR